MKATELSQAASLPRMIRTHAMASQPASLYTLAPEVQPSIRKPTSTRETSTRPPHLVHDGHHIAKPGSIHPMAGHLHVKGRPKEQDIARAPRASRRRLPNCLGKKPQPRPRGPPLDVSSSSVNAKTTRPRDRRCLNQNWVTTPKLNQTSYALFAHSTLAILGISHRRKAFFSLTWSKDVDTSTM